MWRFLNPSLVHSIVSRKAHFYATHNKLLGVIYAYKLKTISKRYAFQIPVAVEIGKGFYIGYNGSIIINPMAKIGCNCNIATGVTIGQENRGERKGAPKIGNRVWIGSNAVVVGKISIGDDVLISPNAYVNFNVPSNSALVKSFLTDLTRWMDIVLT